MAGIRFSGLASGLDTENIIKELMNVEQMRVTKVEKQKTKVEWKKDVWEDMNTKIYDFYKNQTFDLKSSGSFAKKNATVSDSDAIAVSAGVSAPRGTHSIKVDKMAKGSFLTSNKDVESTYTATSGGTFTIGSGDKTANFTVKEEDSITTIIDTINSAAEAGDVDVKASYDSEFKRIFLSTTDTGADSTIEITGIGEGTGEEILMNDLGFSTDGAGKITGSIGQDASFTYNGTSLTSSDNEVSVNGLNIILKQEGMGDAVTINVTQDTDAIYDKVKDFVLKYNELVLDINEKVNASYNKDYEPLTSEEKEAMSDDEVKLWEDKVKNSLLRRDSTLTSLSSAMRSVVVSSSGVDTDGLDYKYLSDLGIVTGSYTEKGILHIQGDEDDSLYGNKTNKLREAIEDAPDKIAEFLNAMGSKLYETMKEKMVSTSISSAMKFYNDKSMDRTISDYEDSILELQERMDAVESRYYSQFTAMEQMIQQMNSQSSSLMGMMGGGQ